MKYEDLTIAECVDKINDSIFLPDIQRPYVWDEDDIYLLFDSICRDYPINTFLFWFLEKKTLEQTRFIKRIKFISERWEDIKVDTSPVNRDNYFLTIDGQQRITSFYLSIKGTYKIKIRKKVVNADLYFNILSGKEENDKEMLYEFQFFPQEMADVWVDREKVRRKTDQTISKYWIRLKYIVGIEQLYEVQSKIKSKVKDEIQHDLTGEQSGILFKLWSKIKYEKIINYYKETTQLYDKVLDIFVRTNSGGEKLSYSDLLFSFIKLKWSDAHDKFTDLLKILNDEGKFKFTHDVILKTILFFHAHDQDGLKYRTANFTDEIINLTKQEWDSKIVNAFKLTKDLLTSRFLLTHDKLITSYNAIIPVIYFIYKFDKRGIGEEDDKLTTEIQISIREWLITSMLTGVFGGQSDGILNKAKKAIEDSSTPGSFPKEKLFEKFKEAKQALILKVTDDLISKASYNSTESFLILSLLYKHSVNFAPLLDENKPQQDHILSRNELRKGNISDKKINSVFNIRFVSASDNRIKSDESFNDWRKRLGAKILENHFIPDQEWNAGNYEQFLAERKEKVIKEIIDQRENG